MDLVLAHAGHWATAAAFFGPVIVLPLGLWAVALRSAKGTAAPSGASRSRPGRAR